MSRLPILSVIFPAALFVIAGPASSASRVSDNGLYAGWLQMYDLKFDEAHRSFAAWKQSYPDDSLGPASNAAAYLFSELARLGALESELFVDDSRFKGRAKLRPDPAKKALFAQEIAQAVRLADAALQIFGGAGFMADLPIERMYRDLRGYRIGEGSSEMQRIQIARHLLAAK